MFDVSFWELCVIGVVALIVIGPERLPGLARQVGFWVGKTRRFVSSVQAEFSQEMSKAEEFQRLVKKELEIKELHEQLEKDLTGPTIPALKQNQSHPTSEAKVPALVQDEKKPE